MKKILTALPLAITCISCQHSITEQPLTKAEFALREQSITQNRKWAWFKPLDKSAPFMEGGGTWHIQERKTLDDSTSTVSFQNNDGTIRITTVAYNQFIFAHMIVIKHQDESSQQLIDMITNGAPKDEKGNWIDEQNNAVISFSRQPNGEQILYKVVYKEFYN